MQLEKKIIYNGEILLLTGMHIGGTNTAMSIGGPDNFVIRNPISGLPYIPGSSLKGKMRALTEIFDGSAEKGKPCTDSTKPAGLLFGTSAGQDGGQPSRLIVRDAPLNKEKAAAWESQTDLPFTESKTEVTIDRITSRAMPRTFERVPAGAVFNFSMVLNVFQGEDEELLKKTLKRAVALLEDDYLGGHGSRGYGQVKITFEQPEEKYYK